MNTSACPVCSHAALLPVRPAFDIFDIDRIDPHNQRRSDLKPLAGGTAAVGAPFFCENCGYADPWMDLCTSGLVYSLLAPPDVHYLVLGDNFMERPEWFRDIGSHTPTWVRWRNAAATAEWCKDYALAFEAFVRASWLAPDEKSEQMIRVRATVAYESALGGKEGPEPSQARLREARYQYLLGEVWRRLGYLACADSHFERAEQFDSDDLFARLAAWQRTIPREEFGGMPGDFPYEKAVARKDFGRLSPWAPYRGHAPLIICLYLGRLTEHNRLIDTTYKWLRVHYGSRTRAPSSFEQARELADNFAREEVPVFIVLDSGHLRSEEMPLPPRSGELPPDTHFVTLGEDLPDAWRPRMSEHLIAVLPAAVDPRGIWDRIVAWLVSTPWAPVRGQPQE